MKIFQFYRGETTVNASSRPEWNEKSFNGLLIKTYRESIFVELLRSGTTLEAFTKEEIKELRSFLLSVCKYWIKNEFCVLGSNGQWRQDYVGFGGGKSSNCCMRLIVQTNSYQTNTMCAVRHVPQVERDYCIVFRFVINLFRKTLIMNQVQSLEGIVRKLSHRNGKSIWILGIPGTQKSMAQKFIFIYTPKVLETH